MLALVLTLAGSGCATLSRGASKVLLPTEDEIALGKKMSQEVEQELKLVRDAEVQRYVDQLGAAVVRGTRNKRPGVPFHFQVVDDPETVNAFALPGGYVYVYSGLLLKAENEAEVVAVLGHEVAHVTARHVADRLTAMYGLQVLTGLALGQNPSQLEQLVAGLVANGYLLKFSRDQESQADAWGVQYEVNAGWDPRGFLSFFETLKAEGGARMPEWLSSHPLPQSRIDHVKAVLADLDRIPSRDGRRELQAIQARLRR